MKDGNVIEVKNLKKKFKVFYDKGNSLKEKILFKKRNRYEERWVLNGINFEIKKGESVGLIGRNGCGKSTTLKILSRILYPTEGTVEIVGRVSSLLELGAGFHPDMSGRENIYTNASIFGLTRKEIDERLEDIIEFSELREFIDNPVRTYSSGMYMRLAFSVAINVDADILLIDEILGVGDINFQAKCFQRLQEIKKNGVTVVIVSHSLEQVEEFCSKAIWIENGKVQLIGDSNAITKEYFKYMDKEFKDKTSKTVQENIKILNPRIIEFNELQKSIEIAFDIESLEKKEVGVYLNIYTEKNILCSELKIFEGMLDENIKLKIKIDLENLILGSYQFSIVIEDNNNIIEKLLEEKITIKNSLIKKGIVNMNYSVERG